MEKISIEEFHQLTKKKSKYGNQKTFYKGQLFHSKKEAQYAQTLDTCRRSNKDKERVVGYTIQVPYPIKICGKHICTYYSDFDVRYADGRKEVVDVKGVRTEVYKIKKKLVEAIYKIKIIEI